jgi:hypothetical protein
MILIFGNTEITFYLKTSGDERSNKCLHVVDILSIIEALESMTMYFLAEMSDIEQNIIFYYTI